MNKDSNSGTDGVGSLSSRRSLWKPEPTFFAEFGTEMTADAHHARLLIRMSSSFCT